MSESPISWGVDSFYELTEDPNCVHDALDALPSRGLELLAADARCARPGRASHADEEGSKRPPTGLQVAQNHARTITATGVALSPTRKQLQTRTIHSQVRFLREFARCGIILRAAQAAGVGRRIVTHWREDPAFEALMAEAHEDALDLLEEEARRRGSDGVLEQVYQGGHKVGSIRRYSDHLLMMFLKGKRRESFSERVETTGAGGAPLAPAVVLVSWHASMKPPEQP